MYKRIALIALLLPFSGYAITKQERREEIIREVKQIEADLLYIHDIVKHNYWLMLLNPDYFKKLGLESKAKLLALQKEFDQIELELIQEKTCTKK